jgi:hypothetical protein
MGIDAHPELADLLLGRGAAERRGAPEPTLLPHLAPIARGEAPGWICESVDLYASGRSGLPPWPDLRNAVFAQVAPGLGRDEDARGLLRRFPGLASFVPDAQLADALLNEDPDSFAPNREQLLVRLAARFPQHGNGALRDAARDAVVNFGGWERGSLLGWLGVAVDASERPAVLGEMLADDSIETESGIFRPRTRSAWPGTLHTAAGATGPLPPAGCCTSCRESRPRSGRHCWRSSGRG